MPAISRRRNRLHAVRRSGLGIRVTGLAGRPGRGRILFERTWFLGWLRGTCGLAFVAVAALLLVLAWDLRSYSLLKPEQPMATLSFQAEGPQRYRVLIQEGANERSVVLDGELWQLDARIFRWKGLAALIGLAPGYRLDALSGASWPSSSSQGRRLGLSQSPLGSISGAGCGPASTTCSCSSRWRGG